MSFHFRDPNYEPDKKLFDIAVNSEKCESALLSFFFNFSPSFGNVSAFLSRNRLGERVKGGMIMVEK